MLRRLDQPDSNVLMWDELENWPAQEKDRFVRLGLLREIEPARSLFLDECEDQPIVTPQWFPDPLTGEMLGRYYCGNSHCEALHVIEPHRMRQWEFGFRALASAVAGAIDTSGRPVVDVGDYSCFLGTIADAGGTRDVFLTCGLWWKDAPEVIADGSRLAASSNATLLCVRRMPPIEQRRASWRAVLSLEEIASVSDAELVVPLARVLEDRQLPITPSPKLYATSDPVLTQEDIDVLEALSERPTQAMLLVELMAAAGYSKSVVRESIDRLMKHSLVNKPRGTSRKGVAITARGVELLASRARE